MSGAERSSENKGLVMSRCIVMVWDGEEYRFLSNRGEHTSSLMEACVFDEDFTAREYIDKHGLERIALVRLVRRKHGM